MVKTVAVTGYLGVLFQKLCFKSCIDMKNAGNGPFDRSQNMGPNCLNLMKPNGENSGRYGLFGCFISKIML